MSSFEELIEQLLEEPEEVLALLSDVVNRGRLQVDAIDGEALEALGRYDLAVFLVQRSARGPVRTWVYPSPLGLKTFAWLERAAERQEEEEKARPVARRRRGDPGVSR